MLTIWFEVCKLYGAINIVLRTTKHTSEKVTVPWPTLIDNRVSDGQHSRTETDTFVSGHLVQNPGCRSVAAGFDTF